MEGECQAGGEDGHTQTPSRVRRLTHRLGLAHSGAGSLPALTPRVTDPCMLQESISSDRHRAVLLFCTRQCTLHRCAWIAASATCGHMDFLLWHHEWTPPLRARPRACVRLDSPQASGH